MQYRFLRDLILLIALIATLGVPAFAADPLAVRYYEDAVKRFNTGDFKGAEIQLKNSLTQDPSQLSARILMGKVQLELGNAVQAEEELAMAEKLGADPILTVLSLAQARNRSGKFQVNLDTLVPTQFPIDQQADLWVELGIARLKNNDQAGAQIAFEAALKIEPLHGGGKLGLARIPLQRGNYAEAERLADLAISNTPDNADAWFAMASAIHAQGRYLDAANAYAQARDRNTNFAAAGLGEASALLDAGETAKASALLKDLRVTFPEMPDVPYLHSLALQQLGLKEEAKLARRAAGELLDPVEPSDLIDNPALLVLVGRLGLENGQLERAYQAMSLYLEARPADIEGRKLQGKIALSMGKPGEARRALVPIVTAGQADAEVLGLLGDASAQQNDHLAAESYYRDAIANYEGGPAIIGRLAASQYRQGQRESALNNLERLSDISPPGTTAGISLYTAMLHFAERRLDKAREITEKVIAEQPESIIALNLQAALSIAEGDNATAHRQLTSLLAKAPEFRPARYNLAKLHVIQGQHQKANSVLARLLADNPNDVRALQELGRLALAQNDRRAAIQHYEKISRIDNKALLPLTELIGIYLQEERLADATQVALNLNRALPDNFDVHIVLAQVQIARDEEQEAQATLKKAGVLAGYDPRRLFRAAQLQKTVSAYEDAVIILEKLLRERPDSLVARGELADTYFRQEKHGAAQAELDKILATSPDSLYGLALRGDIYLAQEQPEKAIQSFSHALQLSNRPELVVSLSRAHAIAGHTDRAINGLQAWHDAHPEEVITLRALAEARHQLGETNAARLLYEKLAMLTPEDPFVHNNIANLMADIDSELAFKAARRAHELAPTNPAILDTMGWALVQVGDLDAGLAMLRDAVARDGRSATIRYHLGVALQEFGSLRESKRELTEALRLTDNAAWADDAKQRLQRLQ